MTKELKLRIIKVDKEKLKLDIPIPSSDGKSVAYTIPVEVPARYDEDLGDYVLDGYAMEEIDRVKARHMGLLQPTEIKALRARLNLTQKEISVDELQKIYGTTLEALRSCGITRSIDADAEDVDQ